jgi:hypothetical protein
MVKKIAYLIKKCLKYVWERAHPKMNLQIYILWVISILFFC